MGFPGAHNVRRRPQGLGVARGVSAPRIGDLSLDKTSLAPGDPWACGNVGTLRLFLFKASLRRLFGGPAQGRTTLSFQA
jgi:hypothetical protein